MQRIGAAVPTRCAPLRKNILDPSKQTMLEIALGYERLAQLAEGRKSSKKE
jgi:hypothetical protein